VISIKNKTTRARMYTVRQLFLDKLAASGARLARIARINKCHGSTSLCRFVDRELHELSPRYISNRFSNAFKSVFSHIFDVQLFKSYELICAYKFTRKFMRKILAFISDLAVNMSDYLTSFTSYWRSLFSPAKFLLSLCKFLFFNSEKSGIVDFLASRERGKGLKTDIDANYGINLWQGICLDFTRKGSPPLTNSISADSQGFNGSFNISMLPNFNRTNFRNSEFVANDPEAGLRKGEAIISVKTPESWEAGFFTSLNTAKERLKGQIHSKLCVLKTLRKSIREVWFIFFPLNQKIASIIQREGFLFFFPHLFSGLKRFIVRPSTSIKRGLKPFLLIAGRIETILICFTHIYILKPLYVKIKDYFNRTAIHLLLKKGSLLTLYFIIKAGVEGGST